MRCLGCKAWKDGKCLAGVSPYVSKKESDGIGCACNTRTVEKLIREHQMTNRKHLHLLSDQELADWIINFNPQRPCPRPKDMFGDECLRKTCKKCIIEWLNSPYENEKDGSI